MARSGLAFVSLILVTACTEFEPFRFTTFGLSNGRVGAQYADTIRTTGGHGNVTMRVTGGQLPPGIGLRVSDRDGVLYGLPSRAGDYSFTVEARDSITSGNPKPAEVISQGFALAVDSL